jgi:hypothetical protein
LEEREKEEQGVAFVVASAPGPFCSLVKRPTMALDAAMESSEARLG